MKSYEAMFLFKPDLSKQDLDKVLNQIQEILTKHKGSPDQKIEWGKQKLSYPIKKYKEGLYYIITFHIDPGAISKIKKVFGLNESILRVLITKTTR